MASRSLSVKVAAAADDGLMIWLGAAWDYRVGSAIRVGFVNSSFFKAGMGLRFRGINIPQGATIESASLRFRNTINRVNTVVNSRISAWDADDAPASIVDTADYLAKHSARTAARVDWDNIPPWSGTGNRTSPDIISVIQEIVDRPGWAYGNDLIIFWDDHDDRSTHISLTSRQANDYETSPGNAPILNITFTLIPQAVFVNDI